MKKLSVTLLQVNAGPEPRRNLSRIRSLLAETPDADLVALPEVFLVRGSHEDYVVHAEPIPGPATDILGTIASERRSWLLAGSIVELSGRKRYNTSILFDRQGNIAATYRKIHLFEASLDTGEVIRESDTYEAGAEPVLAEIDGWLCGMAVCYDIRFPELFRLYAASGAHVFLIPSNFTQRTGRDHWRTLVLARAIENQCFVLAPSQCGRNRRTGVASHGHTMAAGPWGRILCEAGTREQAARVELDPDDLSEVRARIPVASHRRLFGEVSVRTVRTGNRKQGKDRLRR